LSDVRVLDMSLQLPGPYATTLLRHLGADVMSVEPPGGDPLRKLDPDLHRFLSRGKPLLELDLTADEDRALLSSLFSEHDVLVEGFRPGVADRLGFGYAAVSAARPDVIYCSISGFGQDGPYRDIPGHDLNYLGLAGARSAHAAVGRADGQAIPIVDLATATSAALAIVAAIRRRDQTGDGCRLDLAMLDHAVAWVGIRPEGDFAEPTYGVFRAADGQLLSLGVLEDKFWQALCAALDWSDWAGKEAFATLSGRRANCTEIHERLVAAIAERSRAEWLARFARADVPAAAVHAREDVALDAQVVARGLFDLDGLPRFPLPPPIIRNEVDPASTTSDA
jgi:crotonobetainyl-CoA:carnitine CoA-transferase CaiB-like acyl-CoA transferase